jgi:WD40 repeat protein
VAYLPDGRIVASHDRGSVAIWDVDGTATTPMATLGPAPGSSEPVYLIAASPDGEWVAMVRNFSNVVSVWNVGSETQAFEHRVGTPVFAIDWSGDGRYLAFGAYDGSVHVLDVDDGGHHTLVGSEPNPHVLQALAFAPDGRTIATASFNQRNPASNHVSIWDVAAGEVVRVLDAGGVSSLDYSPSGDRLAMGYFDGTVEIRDAAIGDIDRSFNAGSVTIMNVVFSPDGRLLATGGEDAVIRIFDTHAESGAQRTVLRGHAFLVSGLAFGPDGTRLTSAAPDGVVRVWALDLDELIAIAEDELTRELTDGECRQYLHQPQGCS